MVNLKQWGASSGDLIANTFGSLLVIGQEVAWNDQKIQLNIVIFHLNGQNTILNN